MPVAAPGAPEVDALYAQLQRRLVESGEWDRIKSALSSKLSETGWTDELRHRTKERAREMDPLSFRALLEELTPHAQTNLPLAVRREIISAIRQYLEKQFE